MLTKKKGLFVLSLVGVLVFALTVSSSAWWIFGGDDEEKKEETITLRFRSLAWQEQSIKANKEIVADWNKKHPDVQVEYVQGDWGSIHDYMLTSFETGETPDVFHYESAAIADWAERDFLVNLEPLMSEDIKDDIYEPAWQSVALPEGGVYGVPFLWQSRLTIYNKDLFEEAGVEPPTSDNPWTWEDMREAAQKLTIREDGEVKQWGAGFGLRQPGSKVGNFSLSFGGGGFVRKENGEYKIKAGEPEKKVMRILKEMLYKDETVIPSSTGQSASDMMAGFYGEKYAMVPQVGIWIRQQIMQNAPEGFEWGIMPPLKGTSQHQGADTQTLSIPKASPHKEEAMEFIEFFLNTKNMGRLAQGDWMLPTRESTTQLPEFQTEEHGWKTVSESAKHLTVGPWQHMSGFAEFKTRVTNPILQKLFADKLTVEEAAEKIEQEGNKVLDSYQD